MYAFKSILLFIPLLFCCTFFSCKKAKVISNDFTYSGVLFAGDTVFFNGIAPSGNTFSWDFGDDSTSALASPYHVYSGSDSFVVKMSINHDTAHAVKKIIFINPVGFTYSGLLIAGNAINFTSYAPPGSTFLWDFGDSTTSTAQAPNHTFAHKGLHVVTLIIDNNFQRPFALTLNIVDDPIYTNELSGVRSWHHQSFHYEFWVLTDSAVYADETFAITYINKLTISIGTDVLVYTAKDSANLYFSRNQNVYLTTNSSALYFNYVTGKVTYITESGYKQFLDKVVYTSF